MPKAALVPVSQDVFSGPAGVQLEVKDVGHLLLVNQVWDELGFTELLNQAIPADDQTLLRPGTALKALVLNVVCGRDPLYRVQQFFAGQPLDLLLGPDVRPENLNDASLGRHLDRLFEAGGEKVFGSMALRAIAREHLNVDLLHADTTSRLVFGAYRHEEDGDDAISITYGHSKDHRPDMKQVMIGVATTSEGVPVVGQMLDGNQSDKTWNGALLKVLRAKMRVGLEQPLHYVADSAVITRENLETAKAHNIVVTGRLPRVVGACDEAVARALAQPSAWQDIGAVAPGKDAARYQAQMSSAQVLGQDVQLGVYQSTHAGKAARAAVLRRQEKAFKECSKAAAKLGKQLFFCAPDAQAALDTFIHAHRDKMLVVAGSVVATQAPAPAGRGRPKKGAVRGTVEQVRVTITVERDVDAANAAVLEEGCFVLIHTGQAAVDPAELLRTYKGQSVVETRFPFLKSPEWADVFFLKTPARLEALGYVLMMALLVWSLWERRVRLNLKQSKEPPLKDTTGFKKANPTAAVNCHIMHSVKLVRLWSQGEPSPWVLAGPLTPEQARLVRFSGTVAKRLPESSTQPEIQAALTGG